MVGRQAKAKGTAVGPIQAGIDIYLNEDDEIKADAMLWAEDENMSTFAYIKKAGLESEVVKMQALLDESSARLADAYRLLKTIRAKAWLSNFPDPASLDEETKG